MHHFFTCKSPVCQSKLLRVKHTLVSSAFGTAATNHYFARNSMAASLQKSNLRIRVVSPGAAVSQVDVEAAASAMRAHGHEVSYGEHLFNDFATWLARFPAVFEILNVLFVMMRRMRSGSRVAAQEPHNCFRKRRPFP
jgi:hypothetical protein